MVVLLAAVTISSFLKVLLFIAVLSVLVVLHEYGHFLIARLNGVRVLEFSVGMGPLLWAVKSPRSGTQYSLRALPIGGYCAMHGEDNKVSEAEQQREFRDTVVVNGREYDTDNFQAKSPWRRLAIVVAGPVANFLLTFVILFLGGLAFGVPQNDVQPLVGPVIKTMPAYRAGLRAGDLIVSIDGRAITSGDQLLTTIHGSLNKTLTVVYARGSVRNAVRIAPVACPNYPKEGCIGFSPIPAYARESFGATLQDSLNEYSGVAQQVTGGLALLFSHPATYGKQVSGVVGMTQAAGTIQDLGWAPYTFFAAVISFALGIFNLLPFPALDGGRAAFIIGEMIRGKPVDPEKEAWVHVAGFAVLIVLMVVINFYNVVQIAEGKGPF